MVSQHCKIYSSYKLISSVKFAISLISDDVKEERGNDDDWQSSGSRDSKKKQKKKKKRKRGDRRGERAFMVPVHECNQCGKKWRTVTELKSHIASHSDVRPFVCEICGQAYKMKKALDIHIGMHNGIHPFVCTYCNKSFTQKVGLEKHLPIHTGVTRFQVSSMKFLNIIFFKCVSNIQVFAVRSLRKTFYSSKKFQYS